MAEGFVPVDFTPVYLDEPRNQPSPPKAPEGFAPVDFEPRYLDDAAPTKTTLDRLASVIEVRESSGDPEAISPQGARGSMQIMPGTFEQYKRPGEDFNNDADRRAAARRKLEDDWLFYGGDPYKVAAAYIGGRGAVLSDGTVRDDVSDAHKTTPRAYADQVMQRLGGSSNAGAQRGTDIDARIAAMDLSRFDSIFESLGPRRPGPKKEKEPGAMASAGRGAAAGLTSMAGAVGSGVQFIGERLGAKGMADYGKRVADAWDEVGEKFAPQDSIQGSILDDPKLLTKGAWWAYNIANVVPSFAASVVPGVAAGRGLQVLGQTMKWAPEVVSRLAWLGGSIVGGAAGGSLEGAQTYQEVQKRGGSESEAAAAGAQMALASAALNAISLGNLTAKAKNVVTKFLKTGVWEGLTEWAEEPTEGAILSRTSVARPEDDPMLRAREGFNVFPVAAVTGGIGGAMSGARRPQGGAQPPGLSDQQVLDAVAQPDQPQTPDNAEAAAAPRQPPDATQSPVRPDAGVIPPADIAQAMTGQPEEMPTPTGAPGQDGAMQQFAEGFGDIPATAQYVRDGVSYTPNTPPTEADQTAEHLAATERQFRDNQIAQDVSQSAVPYERVTPPVASAPAPATESAAQPAAFPERLELVPIEQGASGSDQQYDFSRIKSFNSPQSAALAAARALQETGQRHDIVAHPTQPDALAVVPSGSGMAAAVARVAAPSVARQDAARMGSIEELAVDDNGSLALPENEPMMRAFLQSLPVAEAAAMVDAQGRVTQIGMRRFQNAVLARAYGGNPVVQKLLSGKTAFAQRLSASLTKMAPMVSAIKDAVQQRAVADRDITDTIVGAVDELVRMKAEGRKPGQAIAQSGLFQDVAPETAALIEFIEENLNAPDRLNAFLQAYLEELQRYGSDQQGELFSAPAAPQGADLIDAARSRMDGQPQFQQPPAKEPGNVEGGEVSQVEGAPSEGGLQERAGEAAGNADATAASVGTANAAEVSSAPQAGEQRGDGPVYGADAGRGAGEGASDAVGTTLRKDDLDISFGNGDNNAGAFKARNGEASPVRGVAEHEGSMRQSAQSVLPQLRRARGDGVPGVEGQLPGLRNGGREQAVDGAHSRQEGQQRELRAGKRALDDTEGPGKQSAQEPQSDSERKNANVGAVGGGDRGSSVDTSLSAIHREDAGGVGLDQEKAGTSAASGADVDSAAHEAATSPRSSRPLPTDEQKRAGNYAKGRVRIGGLDISIENPEGSVRSGTDVDGKRWEIKMRSHYGYIRGTVGHDKDHIDVFVRPGTPENYNGPVVVIDQNHEDGSFDEAKVMVGWSTKTEAFDAYLENYTKGWESRIRGSRQWTLERFKTWLKTGNTKRPVTYKEPKVPKVETKAVKPATTPASSETTAASRETPAPKAETKRGRGRTEPKLSRDGNAFAANALAEFAETDEFFRYPVSKSTDLDTVMTEIIPDVEVLGNATRPEESRDSGADRRFMFRTGNNQDFYVYERGRDIWVDISRLTSGSQGSAVYAAVLNYAHNSRKRLIGDPAGLSADAVARRTNAMLSSALRFGTTRHMDAAQEQRAGDPDKGVAPLRWGGTDVENVRSLIDSSLGTLYADAPELKGMRYDFSRQQFARADGSVVDRQWFVDTGKETRLRGHRGGEASLRRGVLLQSLVSSEAGQRPGILQSVLSRSVSLAREGGLDGVFSRAQAPERGLSTSDADPVARVTAELEERLGRTPDASAVSIIPSWRDLPEDRSSFIESSRAFDVQGMFDPDTGRVYLIADNLPPGAAFSVFLHELGVHKGLREFIGAESFIGLVKQIRTWAELSMGEEGKIARSALARIPAGTDASVRNEEAVAYFVEEAVRRGHDIPQSRPDKRGLGQWLYDLWQSVRGALAKLRSEPGALTAADVVALARGAAERAMSGGDLKYTGGAGAPVMSVAAGQSSTWDAPDPSRIDNLLYTLQDKHIDTRRVLQAINKHSGTVPDAVDPYLQEELFHGRAAKHVDDFLQTELKPLLADMTQRGVTMQEFEVYLHARHAEERNAQIAKVNPNMPDGGSGMTTKDARTFLAGIDPAKKRSYAALASKIDAITTGTRSVLVSNGLESPSAIKAWESTYKNYVPLYREDMEGAPGLGQGFSVKGPASKRAMGSSATVTDIIANIAMQRERAIVRAEKNRVANALVGLAQANPNPDFWQVDRPPMIRYIDERTGLVTERVDPMFKSRENVVTARLPDTNGEIIERSVSFNETDERAMRMARALKNIDMDDMGLFLSASAKVTRYFASINTQFNPVFGVVNITRDVQGALANLSSTPLAGKQAAVLGNTLSALRGIYRDLRDVRAGRQPSSQWSALFEEFQLEGGQTGYRDMFRTSKDRAEAIEKELRKVTEGKAKALGRAVFDWLSDYNSAMENAVRLASYKVGVDAGMSKQRAASLAKNLTVNFNRKGQAATQVGALYAFFNASTQGTARLVETLRGPMGKRIIMGGLLAGVMQAILIAASDLGDDDDTLKDFVKERNLVIPIGDKQYLTIPMPLGLHVLPNIGRIGAEFALSGFKKPGDRLVSLMGILAEAFNPIGSAGVSVQTIAPTAVDPFVALAENKDWGGRQIARKDFSSLNPTPGHTRAKDSSSWISRELSRALNWATGGTEYTPGLFSPTPDQIDYLVGQVAGGVGREALKVWETAETSYTGEDLPSYKVPLLGRFYGNADQPASHAGRFYDAVKEIHVHAAEIKGRRKDGEDIAGYIEEHPEARLIEAAKAAERRVSRLRKQRRELDQEDAGREALRGIDDRINAEIRRFNDRVTSVRATAPAQ